MITCMWIWMTAVYGKNSESVKICETSIVDMGKVDPPYQYFYGWALIILPSGDDSCVLTSQHFRTIENNRTHLENIVGIYLDVYCVRNNQSFIVAPEDEPYIDGSQTPSVWQLNILGCSVSWQTISSLSWAVQVELRLKLFNILLFTNPLEKDYTKKLSNTTAISFKYFPNCTAASFLDLHKHKYQEYKTCPKANRELSKSLVDQVQQLPIDSFTNLYYLSVSNLNLENIDVNFTALGQHSEYWFYNCKLTSFPNVIFPRKRNENPILKAFAIDQTILRPLQRYRESTFVLPSQESVVFREFVLYQIAKEFLPHRLILPFNDIVSVPKLENLQYVDTLDLSFNKIGPNTVHGIRHAKNIYELTLTGNNISVIPINIFEGFHNLEVLHIDECALNDIENVNWTNVNALKFISLKNNNIRSINQLIVSCLNLSFIFAHSNRINALPTITSNPSQYKTEHIALYENVFTTFPAEVKSYSNMIKLILEYNQIDTDGMTTFLDLTEEPHNNNPGPLYISVMYNCIEFIPLNNTEQVDKLNRVLNIVSALWLVGNPLHCGCQEFRDWLKLKGVKHVDGKIYCTEDEYVAYHTRQMLDWFNSIYHTPTCSKYRGEYPYRCQADIKTEKLILAIPLCSLVLFLFCYGVYLCKRYRTHLKMYLFIYTGIRIRLKADKTIRNVQWEYDAFVSYSGYEETDWVVNTLRKRLEEETHPPYQLCINDRDLTIGASNIENIVNAMEDSARTVLVISNASLKCEWEQFVQLNSLWERGVRKDGNYVIPILYPGVDLPYRLRKGFRGTPKLVIGEKHFWPKLEFLLHQERVQRTFAADDVSESEV